MKSQKLKKSHVFLSLIVLFFIIALIVHPQDYMNSTLEGLKVWLISVVPALFPFFFLTKILIHLNLLEKISNIFKPVIKKLFNVSPCASYVFLLSIISGYPVGAKLVSELYLSGKISQSEATRMCSFCSTSGPLFVIGTVGVGLFFDEKIGIIILISHILGAICNGFLFRNYKKHENIFVNNLNTKTDKKLNNILADTIYDSVISILIVGGYVSLFFMFVDVLFDFGVLTFFGNIFGFLFQFFGLDFNLGNAFVSGLIEMTRGCLELSKFLDIKTICVLATGIISFGGLSIFLQSITFLKNCKIKTGIYLFQKICQSILSMIICFILCLLI